MASSSTPEKTTKNSASERFVSLTDEDVERFVEAEANKNTQRNAQRRSIDEVVFAKWKRNKTTPRHTAARIRRLPQQISIVCEKSLVMNMSQQHSEELSLLWSVILETYATASLLSKDNVWQLNCSRGTCLSEFLSFDTRLRISLCVAFDN